MKIAFYIEDGLEQIILTPEGDTERDILKKLDDGSRTLSIRHAKFFHCRGGYVWMDRDSEESTMIVLEKRTHDREGKPLEQS